MIVETIIITSAIIAGREAYLKARKMRAETKTRETWLQAIQTSQEINSRLSAARQAMVDEVRRHQGISQYKRGGR